MRRSTGLSGLPDGCCVNVRAVAAESRPGRRERPWLADVSTVDQAVRRRFLARGLAAQPMRHECGAGTGLVAT